MSSVARWRRWGKTVTKFKPGDRVIADQVLNCHSKRRMPICEYCETGDSHLCAFGEQLGITGLPGAFAELVSIPEANVLCVAGRRVADQGRHH